MRNVGLAWAGDGCSHWAEGRALSRTEAVPTSKGVPTARHDCDEGSESYVDGREKPDEDGGYQLESVSTEVAKYVSNGQGSGRRRQATVRELGDRPRGSKNLVRGWAGMVVLVREGIPEKMVVIAGCSSVKRCVLGCSLGRTLRLCCSCLLLLRQRG